MTVSVPVDFKTKALEIAYELTSGLSYGEDKGHAEGRAKHIRQLFEIIVTPSKPVEMVDPGSHSVYTG